MSGPININNEKITTCDLACKFMYKYTNGGATVEIKENHLSIKPHTRADQNVTYSGKKYQVSDVKIYSPSLHKYNNISANGEVIIYHDNITGGKSLIVCIPIIQGTNENEASQIIKSIVDQTKSRADADDKQSRAINFNLNKFIPQNNYYTYTATVPYASNGETVHYIVFDTQDAIKLKEKDYIELLSGNTIIKNSITPSINRSITPGYSKNFPIFGSSDAENDIYIDCQPTGSDGETLIQESKENIFSNFAFGFPHDLKSRISLSIKSLEELGWNILYLIGLLIAIFGIILCLYGVNKFTNKYNSKTTSNNNTSQTGGKSNLKGGMNRRIKKHAIKL